MKKSLRLLRWFELRRGALPPQELAQCQAELEQSAKLKREFEESQVLFDELQQLAARKSVVDVGFSKQVLVAIESGEAKIVRGSFMNMVVSYVWQQKNKLLIWVLLIGFLIFCYVNGGARNSKVLNDIARLFLMHPELSINSVLLNLQGYFGILLILTSGLMSILMFLMLRLPRWLVSSGFTTVAICCFIIRSSMSTFYSDCGIDGDGGCGSPVNYNTEAPYSQPAHSSYGRKINYNDQRLTEASKPWSSLPSAESSTSQGRQISYFESK